MKPAGNAFSTFAPLGSGKLPLTTEFEAVITMSCSMVTPKFLEADGIKKLIDHDKVPSEMGLLEAKFRPP